MITSLQNRHIKSVVKLTHNARERSKQNLFIIEGARELSMAVKGKYTVAQLFVCEELLSRVGEELIAKIDAPKELVSTDVFRKMAYRDDSGGVIAVCEQKHLSLEGVQLSDIPFIIVIEAIEKPGNLGAILRTADAACVDAVVICDPISDIYNPNTIRSSIGCVFSRQLITCTSEQALNWLKRNGIRVLAATPEATQNYYETEFTNPTAIVMGSEADGLTNFWLENATGLIKIPMLGYADSLNVSVSTAILTFEALRQRTCHNTSPVSNFSAISDIFAL